MGRNYKSETEYNQRFGIFAKNYKFIKNFNKNDAEREGFTLSVNNFADLTDEEKESFYSGIKVDNQEGNEKGKGNGNQKEEVLEAPLLGNPLSLDWRDYGIVPAVKN